MAHSSLSWQQHELLGLLARGRLKTWMHERINAHCGSVEFNRRLFTELGITRPPTLDELLAKRFKVPELKALLRERGHPVGGRKADLAQRLAALADSSIRTLVAEVELTCLTNEGERVLAEFEAGRAKEDAKMQAAAFDSLLHGNLPHAAHLVRDFAHRELLPHPALGATLGGVTLQNSNEHVHVQDEKELLLGYSVAAILLQQPHKELDRRTPNYRRRVAATLALSQLLGVGGFEPARRVMELSAEPFRCHSVEQFLREHPDAGRAAEYEPDDPGAVAEVYVRTRLAEAYAERSIHDLLGTREWSRGVRISTIEDAPCLLCHENKTRYTWDEIRELPKLPRHWGCRCSYVLWLRSER